MNFRTFRMLSFLVVLMHCVHPMTPPFESHLGFHLPPQISESLISKGSSTLRTSELTRQLSGSMTEGSSPRGASPRSVTSSWSPFQRPSLPPTYYLPDTEIGPERLRKIFRSNTLNAGIIYEAALKFKPMGENHITEKELNMWRIFLKGRGVRNSEARVDEAFQILNYKLQTKKMRVIRVPVISENDFPLPKHDAPQRSQPSFQFSESAQTDSPHKPLDDSLALLQQDDEMFEFS